MDFLITGLPRSKTAWLSLFFSQARICACKHEIIAEVGLEKALSYRAKENIFCGFSDSGILFYWEQFRKAYPRARWIHVTRPLADVMRSATKAGIDKLNIEFAAGMQDDFVAEMADKDNYIQLPFDFDEIAMEKVCDFIGISFNTQHYYFLQKYNIQMAQRHVDFLDFSNIARSNQH